MKYTGKIISLAFPDTIVRFSDEKVSKLLPWFGLGKNGVIKAGHAALVLIENKTGKASYYDFGRYITPQGFGRVRSAETDAELEIPFKAIVSPSGELTNLEAFLVWLEANPQKTHGSGKLVASVCNYINYEKAHEFISSEQQKGSMPYRTFAKVGSNCSRIVTDTIIASTDKEEIKNPLLRNKKFSPSPLGNVAKGAYGSAIFQVDKGVVSRYEKSVLKETLQNVFERRKEKTVQKISMLNPELSRALNTKVQLLTGVGSNAYFKIQSHAKKGLFEISRYNDLGEQDFKGVFKTEQGFDLTKEYQFVYDSHCKYCHIKQNAKVYRFDLVKKINVSKEVSEEINSAQMAHST